MNIIERKCPKRFLQQPLECLIWSTSKNPFAARRGPNRIPSRSHLAEHLSALPNSAEFQSVYFLTKATQYSEKLRCRCTMFLLFPQSSPIDRQLNQSTTPHFHFHSSHSFPQEAHPFAICHFQMLGTSGPPSETTVLKLEV